MSIDPNDPAAPVAVPESVPVIWFVGKVQSGKTSIIRALTGATEAEVGNGFEACTRTARVFDFPQAAPVVRFLDTRGIGEANYDPAEDIAVSERNAHLVLCTVRAMDPNQGQIVEILKTVRKRRPEWPVVVCQTCLHEGYESGQRHVLPYPFDANGRPDASCPPALARALTWQRTLFESIPGSPPRFVAIDFTKDDDGFVPRDYGFDALIAALTDAAPEGLAGTFLAHASRSADARAKRAHPQILGYALAAAAADVVPLAGIVAVPGLQAKMLHAVGQAYGVSWNGRTMREFAGALGMGTMAKLLSTFGLRELAKLIPVYGQSVGAVAAAATSFATTYALGKAAGYYLSRRQSGDLKTADVLQTYQRELKAAFNIAKERQLDVSGRPPA